MHPALLPSWLQLPGSPPAAQGGCCLWTPSVPPLLPPACSQAGGARSRGAPVITSSCLGSHSFAGVFLPLHGAGRPTGLCLDDLVIKFVPSVSFKLHIANTK